MDENKKGEEGEDVKVKEIDPVEDMRKNISKEHKVDLITD